jgi:hypothetical protein
MLRRLVLGFVVATIMLTLTPAGSSPEATRLTLEVTAFRGLAVALAGLLVGRLAWRLLPAPVKAAPQPPLPRDPLSRWS